MKILPESWGTDRLAVRDATMDDVPHLRNVFNACSYVSEWDNTFYEETEEAFIKLVSKSLGLNHTVKDIFKMQSVFLPRWHGYHRIFSPVPRCTHTAPGVDIDVCGPSPFPKEPIWFRVGVRHLGSIQAAG